jgi:putative spermidine/putrescine transport system ATP-binding protein
VSSSPPHLEVQNLSRRFGTARAVDGASFAAGRGEIVALIGPSGCGKTTTLRILAGFERADEGVVMLDGRDLAGLPPWQRDIGLVFQDYALFPHMSVAENVAYGLRRRGMGSDARARRVAEMLSLVRLSGLDQRRPAALSGGQQQRVALARALAINPRLLLLDEPLSNLDARLREALRTELRAILREVGTTTLVVTHDQEEAMALADRIAVMHQGRVLQIGTAETLYDRPADRFVAEFVGRTLWFDGAREGDMFRTSDGLLFLCAAPDRVASRYGLAIRPERIRLDTATGNHNAFDATVIDVAFRGAEFALSLAVAGGRRIAIPLARGEAVPAPGTTVSLAVAPEHCRITAA